MNEWHIGLESWIIQDGNYDDFRCNEVRDVALEFYPLGLRPSCVHERQAKWLGGCKYVVNAEVVYSGGAWVLDFGVGAYEKRPTPLSVSKGMWVEAEVSLGVDPFIYYEEMAMLNDMPALIYRWHVTEIGIETAPFIEK